MLRSIILLLSAAVLLAAETHSLTLQQVFAIAARESPDVVLARLDEQHAQQGVQVALNPFRPKVYGGSGLAYTYGYPNSIEGNAPSLFQLKTDMALFNKSDSYQLASARESVRGAGFGAQAKANQVAYDTADLFLTASQLEHEGKALSEEIPSQQKLAQAMSASVAEGTELPLEQKRATVNLAMSQERLESANLDADYYEMMLAIALGYPASDRVKPVDSDTTFLPDPISETDAADTALRNSRELKQMQSSVLAKELDLRSYKAQRLPSVDLVAQYALFSRQNYQNYFPSNYFQPNNAQLGASITIPLLTGPATRGMANQAATDLQKLRVEMDQTRNRIIANTRRSYQQLQKAESIRDLARMQLDLAREQLNVFLAQNGEGRLPMSRVEQARLEESDRWIALYEAETQVTKAKLGILKETGTLLASIRGGTGQAQQ